MTIQFETINIIHFKVINGIQNKWLFCHKFDRRNIAKKGAL